VGIQKPPTKKQKAKQKEEEEEEDERMAEDEISKFIFRVKDAAVKDKVLLFLQLDCHLAFYVHAHTYTRREWGHIIIFLIIYD